MTLTAEQITAAALALPEADRWDLYIRLVESLEPPGSEASRERAADIRAWAEAIRAGRAGTMSWDEVRRRVFGDLDDG